VGCESVVDDVCYAPASSDVRVLVAYGKPPGADPAAPLADVVPVRVGVGRSPTPVGEVTWVDGEGPSSEHRALGRTFHAAMLEGDLSVASETLTAMRRLPSRALEDGLRTLGGEGAYATAVGDARGAVRAWERREALAVALGRTTQGGFPYLADALQRSGAHREALDAYTDALAFLGAATDTDAACRAHGLSISLAWAQLRAEEAGVDVAAWRVARGVGDAASLLDAAAAAWPQGCPDEALRRQTWSVDRALVALASGSVEIAASEVARWSDPPRSAWVALDRERARARVAELRGDVADADAAWRRMEAIAVVADPVHGRLDALEGRARALEALGRSEQARAVGWEALQTAETFAPYVPLDGGRDRFLSALTRVVEALARSHRQAGDPAGALAAWRTHRRAFLASVRDAMQSTDPGYVASVVRYRRLARATDAALANAWQLPADKLEKQHARIAAWVREARRTLEAGAPDVVERSLLPDVGLGEALVLWTGREEGGVAYVRRPDGATVAVETASEVVPTALRAAVAGASRIRLLVPPVWADADLHLRGSPGERLIDVAPVAWSLDVGVRPASPGRGAGLVVDPTQDLRGARGEGLIVADALASTDAPLTVLEGERAVAGAVADLWRTVDLLHHAGHGEAGEGPWGARLLLAADSALGVPDVLAAGRSPRRVVLSGCETARGPGTEVANLGMAQAFVLMGAEAVVAATRPIDDAETAAFVRSLYAAGWADADAWAAFRTAAAPGFRLIVP
jgi:tetratricopeptide (TPR) repeat protein